MCHKEDIPVATSVFKIDVDVMRRPYIRHVSLEMFADDVPQMAGMLPQYFDSRGFVLVFSPSQH